MIVDSHVQVHPKILYFGTPVALVTTLNPDGSANIGPMSSAWALGDTVVLGWAASAQTTANLERERECVINFPDADLHERVVAPPRIAECQLQLEARVCAMHRPAGPEADDFVIVETHAVLVHAHPDIVVAGTEHIDPQREDVPGRTPSASRYRLRRLPFVVRDGHRRVAAEQEEWTMRKLNVFMSMSLDGVVQGPGRADEDTRGGFTAGGWGQDYQDGVLADVAGAGMSRPGDMLFGHRTWRDFIFAWGTRTDGNPFSTHMNRVTKYVASRTLNSADEWQNSSLLRGEASETVADLKAQSGNDLMIVGSAALVRSLHAAGLIDHYTLLIHPLTIGAGARLFDGPAPLTRFALTGSVVTGKGVIVADYERK